MIHNFKPYSAYKDSGVSWLGEIPAHWEVIPLKRVTVSRCDGPFGSGLKSSHYTDSGTRVIRLQNIGHGMFRPSGAAFIPLSYARSLGDHSVVTDDLLIAGLGDDRHPAGRACVAPPGIEPAMVKADCFRFRLRTEKALPHFTAMQLTATAEAASAVLSTGATRQRINLVSTSDRAIALPPLVEQFAITRFLENVNHRIPCYIRAKKKLITLLNEQKQAIIHRSVTRGLDPRVRLKPSGVEWLGEVPEHWQIVPLKFISGRIQNGATPPTSDLSFYEKGTIPWYGPSSCGHLEEVGVPIHHLRDTAFSAGRARLIRSPALLVVVIGATAGRMALLPGEGSVNQQITSYELCSSRVDPRFVLRQLRGSESWLRSTASSATIPILDSGVVSRLPVALPSLREQQEIIGHIDLSTIASNRVVEKATREIDLLREYNIRLVADVITGKLDVREAAARLPEEIEDLEPLDEGEASAEEDGEGEGVESEDSAEEAVA